jgi:hypothetical protein
VLGAVWTWLADNNEVQFYALRRGKASVKQPHLSAVLSVRYEIASIAPHLDRPGPADPGNSSPQKKAKNRDKVDRIVPLSQPDALSPEGVPHMKLPQDLSI